MKAAALALFLVVGARAQAVAPRPDVVLTREGGVFRLEAGFTVDAPAGVVWGVLTDYNQMPSFLSSLKKSKVLEKTSKGAVIEQEGSARLLIFSHDIKLKLDVNEKPPTRIEFRDLGGSEFEEYDGAWTIHTSSMGTSVSYELFAEMTPSMVPRALARKVLEKSVHRQLQELAREIVRRTRALGKKAGGG